MQDMYISMMGWTYDMIKRIKFLGKFNKRYVVIKLVLLVVQDAYGSQNKAEVLINHGQMEIIHLDLDLVLYDGMEMWILNKVDKK